MFTRLHAAAVVYDQSEAYRNIFMLEHGKPLLELVLENAKVLPLQISDGPILLISDTDVDFGEIHVHIQFVNTFFLSPQERSNQ